MRAVAVTGLLILLLVRPAVAQVLYLDGYRDYPAIISVGSLDAEISKGKLEAARNRRPELEFEIVKLSIKDIVERNRADRSQQVSFATPERFRKWLQDTSRKLNRPYDELVEEIVDAVAPNPVPDLTGYSDRYLRERAINNLDRRESAPPPYEASHEGVAQETIIEDAEPAMEDVAASTTKVNYTRPPGNPALIKIEYSDEATTKTRRKK